MKKMALTLWGIVLSATFIFAQNEASKHQFGILVGGVLVEQIGTLPLNSTPTPYQEEIGSGFSLGILYQYQINLQ